MILGSSSVIPSLVPPRGKGLYRSGIGPWCIGLGQKGRKPHSGVYPVKSTTTYHHNSDKPVSGMSLFAPLWEGIAPCLRRSWGIYPLCPPKGCVSCDNGAHATRRYEVGQRPTNPPHPGIRPLPLILGACAFCAPLRGKLGQEGSRGSLRPDWLMSPVSHFGY